MFLREPGGPPFHLKNRSFTSKLSLCRSMKEGVLSNCEPKIMQIQVSNQACEVSPEFIVQVERRIHLALGRFTSRVRSAAVCFFVSSEEGRATEHECRITIRTEWKTQIRIEEKDSDLFAAVARAADRTGRAVERQTRLRYGDGRSRSSVM